jgi:hypothetical protein
MRLEVEGEEQYGRFGQFMGSTAIALCSSREGYTIAITCNLSKGDLVKVLVDLQRMINGRLVQAKTRMATLW